MAKNLFEQFISMFGDKLPGSKEQQDYPVYTKHPSGQTGVERYLARQALAEQARAVDLEGGTSVDRYLAKKALAEQEASGAAGATGVEKYLARQGTSETAASATRVDAYLARQEEKPARPKTRVEKYLAEQAETNKPAAVKEPATGVEKYLAEAAADDDDSGSDQTAARVAQYLADHGSNAVSESAVVEEVVQQTDDSAAATADIDAGEASTSAAGQCQAATAKGTQCTRTVNLVEIDRTIGGKDYRFTVCNQHNSESFKPFPAFVDNIH